MGNGSRCLQRSRAKNLTPSKNYIEYVRRTTVCGLPHGWLVFPKKSGHEVKGGFGYAYRSNSSGETCPKEECRRTRL